MKNRRRVLCAFLLVLCASAALAADAPIPIPRATTPPGIDGVLGEGEWANARRFEEWFETNPGDNVPPKVKSVGYVTYDDRFFYVAIEMEDPNPRQIASPYSDHDGIRGTDDDFAGIIVDTRNDGKTATEFFVTARNTQFDAVQDDATDTEDSSPDFFWDSAVRIHERGWSLEMRIPFSSLRYGEGDPQTWGLILYRNMPRDRRYQMFTHRLPRGSNCFVCNFDKITDLRGLPSGGHIIAAPYLTARQIGQPREGSDDIVTRPVSADVGADVKWTPSADAAIDLTLNPDFSQIESDVAAITANERFAVFYPEKRPFFLEGVELFNTPIQAVYTRTITSPRFGMRGTGKFGENAYTLLVAQDRGGGSVILPSPEGSSFADRDFSSTVAIGRVRHDFGRSFVSFLATTREAQGDGYNRVFGPDFQWRISDHHTLTGQLLFSATETPNRPEIAAEWDGRKLSSHAGFLWYSYSSEKVDVYAEHKDYGDDFRADNGFIPQVGFRATFSEAGYTWRPKGWFNRVRGFTYGEYDSMQDGAMLYRLGTIGVGLDGRYRSFFRFRLSQDSVRSGDAVFDRTRFYYQAEVSPSKRFTRLTLSGWVGDEVDFFRNRDGKGADISLTGTLRPNNHLQIALTGGLRFLNVEGDRLFTSQIERIRATWTFDSRKFIRAIVQNQRTNSDEQLYGEKVGQHSGELATQLLFAYKLNWQTVLFVGAGDLREVSAADGDFQHVGREIFLKVSYAFQR